LRPRHGRSDFDDGSMPPVCARQAAKQYREQGQTARDYSGEDQQEEPLIHEAGAGEVEVSERVWQGRASDP
jgi:hypothetical protein